jgi:G:T-mismatch repair DNA endonuclease (very short patch repair protein)
MDNLTAEQRRKNMQRIRSTGTKAERSVMNELQKKGLVFTSHDKSIIGKPDIIFPEKKIAIFIDSDFWHGNPKRFVRNQGWRVIRIWEYDVKNNLNYKVNRIIQKLNAVGKLST